jgi:hypothetical protein
LKDSSIDWINSKTEKSGLEDKLDGLEYSDNDKEKNKKV